MLLELKIKMTNKKLEHFDLKFDPQKLLVADNMRLNLMLSSLYLTAFEMLKSVIVQGTKDYFVFVNEVTEADLQELQKTMQDRLAERFRESYLKEVDEYEKEIGIRLKEQESYGLIPSCNWLKTRGVLANEDVEEIKSIRAHRNQIAHELPILMVTQNVNVNIDHFLSMHRLLHKVDVFWARNDLLFDPETLEEVEFSEVPDDEIRSLRLSILELITQTVFEYVNEIQPNGSEIYESDTYPSCM